MRLRNAKDLDGAPLFRLADLNGELVFELDVSQRDLSKLNIAVALSDVIEEICRMVDINVVESQINREIARRFSNVSNEAMASGRMSEVWSGISRMFTKHRKLLYSEGK